MSDSAAVRRRGEEEREAGRFGGRLGGEEGRPRICVLGYCLRTTAICDLEESTSAPVRRGRSDDFFRRFLFYFLLMISFSGAVATFT